MNHHLAKAIGLLLVAAVVTSCTSSETRPTAPPGAPAAPDALGHIHGLGVDPADDALFVATHLGLHRVSADGDQTRIADRYDDLMGFTVIGPRHFLASGHPEVRADTPPHLGLIESTDAGKTWKTSALPGEADFHILEPAGKTLYAYDSLTGTLRSTTNRSTFRTVMQTPLLSIAALPDPDVLMGTNHQAQLVRIDAAAKTVEPMDGPRLVVLDTTSAGDLVGLAPDGTLHVSSNAGKTWRPRGSINGVPAALTTSTDSWYAATPDSVHRSTDRGKRWTVVLDGSGG